METFSEKVGQRIIDSSHLKTGSTCNNKGCAVQGDLSKPVYINSNRLMGACSTVGINSDSFKPETIGKEAMGKKMVFSMAEQFVPKTSFTTQTQNKPKEVTADSATQQEKAEINKLYDSLKVTNS